MNADPSIQLEAAFETIPLLDVGAFARLRISIRNDGTEELAGTELSVESPLALLVVAPPPWLRGDAAGQKLRFAVPALVAGERFSLVVNVFAVAAADATIAVRLRGGGTCAECAVQCVSEGRAAFDRANNALLLPSDEIEAASEIAARAIVTNTGTAPARAQLRVDGDVEIAGARDDMELDLAPCERRIVPIALRAPVHARDGAELKVRATLLLRDGEIVIGERKLTVRSRPRFEGTIAATAGSVRCGESVAWQLRLTNAGGGVAHVVRVALQPGGASYVAGSTTLNGARLVDVAGTSPLWSAEGLCVERVPPGAHIAIDCVTVAEAGVDAAVLFGRIVCDGREVLLESPAVRIEAPAAAAVFPFTVRDVLVASAAIPQLDAATAAHLGATRGLVRHLWAIGTLCGDGRARASLRSVFDRLCIKLRMPLYDLRSEDVLDGAAIDALHDAGLPLGERLGQRLSAAASLIAAGDACVPSAVAAYRDALRARLDAMESDAAVLAALTADDEELDRRLDHALARNAPLLTA